MPVEPYSLEQAEEDIGQARGDVDRLNELLTQFDIGSSPPNTPTGGYSQFSLAGTPTIIRDSGHVAAVRTDQADTTTVTVTQATPAGLSAVYTIEATDLAVNTGYMFLIGGTGTWGNPAQQLTLIEAFAGTNINQINVAQGAFSPGDPFDWDLWMSVICKTTGVSGTLRARLAVILSKNNSAITNNGVSGARRAVGVAVNTTISNTFQLEANWASVTGAPTITSDYSMVARIGP